MRHNEESPQEATSSLKVLFYSHNFAIIDQMNQNNEIKK